MQKISKENQHLVGTIEKQLLRCSKSSPIFSIQLLAAWIRGNSILRLLHQNSFEQVLLVRLLGIGFNKIMSATHSSHIIYVARSHNVSPSYAIPIDISRQHMIISNISTPARMNQSFNSKSRMRYKLLNMI